MFVQEAKWIGDKIRALQFDLQLIRCLNLGSSTRVYREINQPHVHKYIFEPLLQSAEVIHADIKAADGVDIAGDFMDEAFWKNIPARSFNLVMCSNLLTHVTDQNKIYKLIHRSVVPRGYVVISTPQIYPYCADPFDAKYRPSLEEILVHFKSFELIAETRISLDDSHFSRLQKDPKAIVSFVMNLLLPLKGMTRWKSVISDVPNIFKPLTSVCLVLRAPADEG